MQRIGQHQPAFRIGIHHLDRPAGPHAKDVAGPVGGAAEGILGQGQDRHGRGRGVPQGKRQHRPGAGGGSGHIGLHGLHAGACLMLIPPVSKQMPLPTKATGGAATLPRQRSTASRGGLSLPWPTASSPPRPSRASRLRPRISTVMPIFGQRFQPGGEGPGGQCIGRLHRQIAGQQAAADPGRGGGPDRGDRIRVVHHQVERPKPGIRLIPVPGEAPGRRQAPAARAAAAAGGRPRASMVSRAASRRRRPRPRRRSPSPAGAGPGRCRSAAAAPPAAVPRPPDRLRRRSPPLPPLPAMPAVPRPVRQRQREGLLHGLPRGAAELDLQHGGRFSPRSARSPAGPAAAPRRRSRPSARSAGPCCSRRRRRYRGGPRASARPWY